MVWGNFGIVHIGSLAVGAAILVGLYFLLRLFSREIQTAVLGILSLSGIGAIIFNLVAWDQPLAYLPLHLCSLNALVLPFAVMWRNKTLGNLLLVWSLGALAALVLNNEMAHAEVWSWTFFFYYFPHLMEFGIPILLFALGHVKKDPRCILPTVGISMGAYTLIHFANLLINAYCQRQEMGLRVNYMFSLQPNNPLTELFYKLIPHSYWYMYMIIPILVVYLLLIYAPQLWKKKKC